MKKRILITALIILVGALIGTDAALHLAIYLSIVFYVVTEKRHKIF